MTKALDYYRSFFADKLSPNSVLRPGEIEQGFAAGTYGAFVSGPWHMALVHEAGGAKLAGKWAVTPMPTEQINTSFVGGGDLVVFKDAKNRDTAWKFVQYLSRPDVQVKWYETAADLPAVKAAWQDPRLAGDKMLAVFGAQLQSAKAPPAIPTWEQVASAIEGEIEKVAKGSETPAAAAKAMQQKATAIGTGR